MEKKGKECGKCPCLMATIVAVVAIVALIGSFAYLSNGVVEAAGTGACVIIPNQQAPVESVGQGVVKNADHVCDAATNGCEYCLAQCSMFNKIVDKYGCLDEPDCGPDGCISGTFQVKLNDAPLTLTPECGNFYVELLDGTLVPNPVNSCTFDTGTMTAKFISTTCEKYFPVDSCILGMRFTYDTTVPLTAPSSVVNLDFSELDMTALFSFQEKVMMVQCKGNEGAGTILDLSTVTLGSNLVTIPGPCPGGLRIDMYAFDEAY